MSNKSRKRKADNIDNYQTALKTFVKGLIILEARLTGQTISRFHPLYNLVDDIEIKGHLHRLHYEESKLFINCGKCMMESNRAAEALEVFQCVTEEFPKTDDWLFYKAKCLFQLGDYNNCKATLNQCLGINKENKVATKMLQETENKLKNSPSTPFASRLTNFEVDLKDVLGEMAMKKRETMDSDLKLDVPKLLGKVSEDFIIDKKSFVLSNRKREIVNKILKPCSGYGTEWKLENEYGFERCDMYNFD